MKTNNLAKSMFRLSVLVILTCCLAACNSQPMTEIAPDTEGITITEDTTAAVNVTDKEHSDEARNPFKQSDPMEEMDNSLGHGPTAWNMDGNGKPLPWVYDGHDIQINYEVHGSGKGRNIGFLMFLDGIPQPYKIDNADAPYEYMHIFDLKEDDTEYPFTFIFSPVTGKKGDTLILTIASVYNPKFIPDMVESVSYASYHSTLSATSPLTFNADAEPHSYGLQPGDVIKSMTVTSEPVTDRLMDEIESYGFGSMDTDTFNSRIFHLVYYDGMLSRDSQKVADNSTFNVKHILCGHSGLEYTTTFYVNHQPIAGPDAMSVDTTIEKGVSSAIEIELDTSKLADFNTFYAISVPKNADDFPDGIFTEVKTNSILLYKEANNA